MPCPDDPTGVLNMVIALPAWHVGWQREDLACAQRDDPDMLQRLTQGEGKPTPTDLQRLSTVTKAIWAQFELLHVVNDMLYIRQPQAQPTKDQLVLPADLVNPALELTNGYMSPNAKEVKKGTYTS